MHPLTSDPNAAATAVFTLLLPGHRAEQPIRNMEASNLCPDRGLWERQAGARNFIACFICSGSGSHVTSSISESDTADPHADVAFFAALADVDSIWLIHNWLFTGYQRGACVVLPRKRQSRRH